MFILAWNVTYLYCTYCAHIKTKTKLLAAILANLSITISKQSTQVFFFKYNYYAFKCWVNAYSKGILFPLLFVEIVNFLHCWLKKRPHRCAVYLKNFKTKKLGLIYDLNSFWPFVRKHLTLERKKNSYFILLKE